MQSITVTVYLEKCGKFCRQGRAKIIHRAPFDARLGKRTIKIGNWVRRTNMRVVDGFS